MARHRLGVAAELVDDKHAILGCRAHVDGVEAGAVGGGDQEARHARDEIAPEMEARRKLVARW